MVAVPNGDVTRFSRGTADRTLNDVVPSLPVQSRAMPPVEMQPVHRTGAVDRERKRRRNDLPIVGDGTRWTPTTWLERLRRDRRCGGWGLVVSILLHASLLFVFALWIVQLPRRDDGDPFIMSWLRTAPAGGVPAASTRQPVRIPIDLGPGAIVGMAKQEPPGGQANDADKTHGPPVKPVDVTQSLTRRTTQPSDLPVGGTDDARQAIRRGLDWLKRVQLSDGRWELHQGYPDAGSPTIKSDTGATGLALLSLLGDGHTHRSGDFIETMDRGLKWLRQIQDPATGDLHDMRFEEGRQPAVYSHALATIALCEALALTEDEQLREPAQRAVNYLLSSQHPDQGGWKYRPIFREANGDLSVTGWALMALHTARIAGIDVPLHDFEKASAFLDTVQEAGGARYKYEPLHPKERVTPALTAEGLLCRQWLGWPKNHPAQINGIEYILSDAFRPQWSNGKRNVYAWYYAAQVLHNRGGDEWRNWYLPTRDLIVKNQVKSSNPKVRGSWHPTQPPGMGEEYAEKAGRLYLTSLCLLILETPTRHAPIYGDE
jgi:hypothetical protein